MLQFKRYFVTYQIIYFHQKTRLFSYQTNRFLAIFGKFGNTFFFYGKGKLQ